MQSVSRTCLQVGCWEGGLRADDFCLNISRFVLEFASYTQTLSRIEL